MKLVAADGQTHSQTPRRRCSDFLFVRLSLHLGETKTHPTPHLLLPCLVCFLAAFLLFHILTTRGRRRQSHDRPDGLSYRTSIMQIIKKDGGGARGALGVFGRGLGGRVAASALQVKRRPVERGEDC